ncbi:MAG TPA: hypothetical protein DHW39_09250 [Erysipelotrichaceae bacterium]|nr:hypothetical protein [Erysipelotrichaceae bacterium]
MKAKTWLTGWTAITLILLGVTGTLVYRTDPYMHYHKPDTEHYYYTLDNERSQNDGIIRNFDYDAMITGSSMTENFRTSEADVLFDRHFIKVPFSGGSYGEINRNIINALKYNPDLKTVIRCLDMNRFLNPWDETSNADGTFPEYLYDHNPFNDVEYLFNRDIVFKRSLEMLETKEKPGITSFDEYARWQEYFTFGIHSVCPEGITDQKNESPHLSEELKEVIRKNIEINVTSATDQYPDVEFYYFFSPYSIAWWNYYSNEGYINRQLEAEQLIAELIVPHQNIHLFSFNGRTDIITDLNNYKDTLHYGSWVNSLILKWMKEDQYRLTQENYQEILAKEKEFFTSFDYASLNEQQDYEADNYTGALLNRELTGAVPMEVTQNTASFTLNNAEWDGSILKCRGRLHRSSGEDLAEYLIHKEYAGAMIKIHLDGRHRYLSFYGQKIRDHGRPSVYVYREDGSVITGMTLNYTEIDNNEHHYVLELNGAEGDVTIIFNGGYVDSTGSELSEYHFSNIELY